MRDWKVIGRHRYFVDNDILFWEPHGVFELSEAEALIAVEQTIFERHGYFLVVIDMSDGGTPTPQARKRLAERPAVDPKHQGASAAYGTNLVMRTVISMVLSATRLLGTKSQSPMRFVKSEAQAWDYIHEQRALCRHRLGLPEPPASGPVSRS